MMDNGFYASIRTQRILVWTSVVLLSLYGFGFAGLMGFFPPPSPNLPADQVAQIYATNNMSIRIGAALAITAGGCIIPLTLVTSIQMARLEKGLPIWSIMQGLTGTLGSVLMWLPMIIFAAAAFSPERAPEITLIFHEFGWLFLVTPLSLFPLQLIGIIIIAFSKDEDDRVSAFPRWMGYLTAWNAVQAFGGPVAILFKSGIFSWNGLIPLYLPMSLFGVWIGALTFTILRALRHQERAGAGGV